MSECALSVIIPSYRPGLYIFDCLDSLKRQTLQPQLFEVIIILNGEKDPFYEQIKAFIGSLHNFKLLHTSNAGVSIARNIGLNTAKGTHIVFLDDDDFLSDNFLRTAFNLLSQQVNAVVASNFMCHYGQGDIRDDYMSGNYRNLLGYNRAKNLIKFRKVLSSSCGKALPVAVIQNIRFKENMKISEDALFMFQISKNIKSIVLCPIDTTYFRRVRVSSASRKKIVVREQIKIYCKSLLEFSKVYFSDPNKYDFLFFINRIMAITKHSILRLIK